VVYETVTVYSGRDKRCEVSVHGVR